MSRTSSTSTNYTNTDNTNTGNLNEKPTVGEKLKAAFSSKTADEIHAENLAKKQGFADGQTPGTLGNIGMGTTTMDMGQSRPTTTMAQTQSTTTSNTVPVIHPEPRTTHQTTTHMNTTQGPVHTMPGSNIQTKTETGYTVRSVAKDAFDQIAMQEREALAKAEELRRQDEARLMKNSTTAFAQLDAQADALKAQVDKEKLAAEAAITAQQASKVDATKQRAEMEKAAIHQAAVQRRAELEAKANKLQSEIEELTRLKTQEMMMEKPGDLQFQHVREDTGVVAKLTGAVSHKLGLAEKQTVTESITHGNVQHQPVQITKQYESGPAVAATNTQSYTRQGEWHELPAKSATGGVQDQGWTSATGTGVTTGRQDLADSKRNI